MPVKVEIDEETLRKVAGLTGGRYFRATSEKKLEEIYREIGEMEKQDIKTRDYVDYTDQFPKLLWPGLFLLGLEVVLANTRFRNFFEFHGNFEKHFGIFPGCGTEIPYADSSAESSSTSNSCC